MEDYQDILNNIIGEHAKIDVKVSKAIKKMKEKNINPDEVFLGNAIDRPKPTV